SWFAFDMKQPGVEVRPLREMTGNAMFNEVFFTDAVVADEARIGDVNNGWTVANTTLLFERSGMGAGGDGPRGGMSFARAGTVAGDLSKRAGDMVARRRAPAADTPKTEKAEKQPSSPAQLYIDLARLHGKDKDPAIRQKLAQSHSLGPLRRL